MPRSTFNRSHGVKTTFSSAFLTPFYVDEMLPGDTIKVRTNSFIRMATPLKPVADNMYFDTFFFSVPVRLLWDNWQAFMGERFPDPTSTIDFEVPKLDLHPDFENESIFDYMGLPTNAGQVDTNCLPFRAYNLIFSEWFRSQDLQSAPPLNRDDGPDPVTDYKLLRRNKKHDYFTGCLPNPQKGDPVELNLGGQAPLVGNPFIGPVNQFAPPTFLPAAGNPTIGNLEKSVAGANTDVQFSGVGTGPLFWDNPNLFTDLAIAGLQSGGGAGVLPFADLGAATSITVNDLRESFAVQRVLEKDQRAGSRYVEVLLAHFGVRSPDERMQRPEYCGGNSSRINVHPVAQMTQDIDGPGENTPQGNLAAFVTGGSMGDTWVKSFSEHTYVLGLMMVRADLTYQTGLHKLWSRKTRYDFYLPAFAHLGEQEVLSKEIWSNGTPGDEDIFGYQERWAELRYKPSMITGKFRSNDPQSLDVWHLSQDFETRPVLNEEFIQEDPPIARVIAVPSEPEFLADIWLDITHSRVLPTYSVPGLIDHF